MFGELRFSAPSLFSEYTSKEISKFMHLGNSFAVVGQSMNMDMKKIYVSFVV